MIMSRLLVINPDSLARPRGYSHGVKGQGELVFVAGQIGWDRVGTVPKEKGDGTDRGPVRRGGGGGRRGAGGSHPPPGSLGPLADRLGGRGHRGRDGLRP